VASNADAPFGETLRLALCVLIVLAFVTILPAAARADSTSPFPVTGQATASTCYEVDPFDPSDPVVVYDC
jgi:hypothetical protein